MCKRRIAACKLLRQTDFKNPDPNPLLDPALPSPVSFAAHHWKHYGWGTLGALGGVKNQRWYTVGHVMAMVSYLISVVLLPQEGPLQGLRAPGRWLTRPRMRSS